MPQTVLTSHRLSEDSIFETKVQNSVELQPDTREAIAAKLSNPGNSNSKPDESTQRKDRDYSLVTPTKNSSFMGVQAHQIEYMGDKRDELSPDKLSNKGLAAKH